MIGGDFQFYHLFFFLLGVKFWNCLMLHILKWFWTQDQNSKFLATQDWCFVMIVDFNKRNEFCNFFIFCRIEFLQNLIDRDWLKCQSRSLIRSRIDRWCNRQCLIISQLMYQSIVGRLKAFTNDFVFLTDSQSIKGESSFKLCVNSCEFLQNFLKLLTWFLVPSGQSQYKLIIESLLL